LIQLLKKWRKTNDLSQTQAVAAFQAEGLPVTLDTLQKWEIGRNTPSRFAAIALSDFLARHSKISKRRTEREPWWLRTPPPQLMLSLGHANEMLPPRLSLVTAENARHINNAAVLADLKTRRTVIYSRWAPYSRNMRRAVAGWRRVS
jgi:hypothetical protein